jgi:VWFA-related protein
MKLLSLLALLLMQQQAPFVEQIEVRIHNIDVVVTDKDGNAVEGLRKDDLELLEDGKPQPITNFAAYSEKAAATVAGAEAPAAEAAAAPQAPPPRKIVFFVDEMSLTEPIRNSLSKNASEMLGRTMRPGDEAIVIRPANLGDKVSVDFTDDRQSIQSSLTNAIQAQTYRPDIAFEGEMRRFLLEARLVSGRKEALELARRHAAKVKQRVLNRLTILRALIATMAPMPGRKVLVTITESLPAEPGREFFDENTPGVPTNFDVSDEVFKSPTDTDIGRYNDLRPVLNELARMASSNGITMYGLQPQFDLRIAPGGDVTNRAPGGENIIAVQHALDNTKDTMNLFADKTGGKFLVGDSRSNDLLHTIERDVASYYSLAYRAGDDFDKPHKVAVRVRNHPEYNIRARNEVTRKSPPREMTDRVVAALVTANVPNELGIAARANPPMKEKRGGYNVDVDVGVLIGRLLLIREGDKYRGKFTVHYAVSASESDFVSGMDKEQIVEIPVAEYEAAKSKVWRHTLHMKMTPGEHHIAVGLLDGLAQRSGMATLKVDVR